MDLEHLIIMFHHALALRKILHCDVVHFSWLCFVCCVCGLSFSAESLGIKKSHLWKLLSFLEVLIVLLSFNPNVKPNGKPLKKICMVMEDVPFDLMRAGQTHKI